MQIRACHEREYRANAYERVQRVDCLDSVFVIVRVISVPVRVDTEKKKKKSVFAILRVLLLRVLLYCI